MASICIEVPCKGTRVIKNKLKTTSVTCIKKDIYCYLCTQRLMQPQKELISNSNGSKETKIIVPAMDVGTSWTAHIQATSPDCCSGAVTQAPNCGIRHRHYATQARINNACMIIQYSLVIMLWQK